MSDNHPGPLSIEAVRTANAASGAGWQAEENEFWNLPDDVKRRRLGAVPPGTTMAAREETARRRPPAAAAAGAPSAHDWRSAQGLDYVTAVRDQGECGSCVAFGTIATVEVTARVRYGATLDVDLSEAQLFYCGGGAQGRTCANGWWPDPAYPVLESGGITDEAHFPYEAGDQSCGLRSGWQDSVTKVTAWHTLSSVADMKAWLATRGALTACFSVYADFYAYSGGVYAHRSGDFIGGHCVAIVGYDDAGEYWICKNSWGPGFGEDGFFRIRYGECGIDAEAWAVDGVIVRTPGTVPLYRYWNPGISDHFYTTNWAELGGGNYGWTFEETQCYVFPNQVAGSVPLYRYWNGQAGDHFYTTNLAELGQGGRGYAYEGIQCYVFPGGGVCDTALYRYYSPAGTDHFYTTNYDELGSGNYGWHLESTQCFVPGGPGAAPAARISAPAPATFRPGALVGADGNGSAAGFARTAEPEPVAARR